MSALQVGDIIRGYYVDASPRYYKVMKVTPQRVKVLRLTHRFSPDGAELGPGANTYGTEFTMTKKGERSASHYGMIFTRLDA